MIQKIRKVLRKFIGRRRERCIIDYGLAQRSTSNVPYRLLLTAARAPMAIAASFRSTIPYVEMDITSRCSLNCKECSHHIPMHKQQGIAKDFDVHTLLDTIDLFLRNVNQCLIFRVLGGEPFMHGQLHLILGKLAAEKKIKHVQVVTNGTIVPKGETLAALMHEKVSVEISNYGDLAANKEEVYATLQAHNVHVKLDAYHPIWYETDRLLPRGYSKKEMESVFFNCSGANCKTLYDGKLWLCPQALHGALLGLTKENAEEAIELRTCTRKEFWTKIDKLYDDPGAFTTCYFCKGGCSEFSKQVPCAEQVS